MSLSTGRFPGGRNGPVRRIRNRFRFRFGPSVTYASREQVSGGGGIRAWYNILASNCLGERGFYAFEHSLLRQWRAGQGIGC